ncbi:MAG: DUF2330 domain-containing protein [Verrucomicrobiota bacterium]|jgi:hypothetical protein
MGRFLTSLAFLFMTGSCWADGMVVHATAVPVEVRIPDQRALIHFSNGVERLVIETRFTGAGTNFAWVVPLPSPPVIEEASTGLFPTLQSIFQPRVRHEVPHYFQLFLGLLAAGYLLRYVRHGSSVNLLDLLACVAVAAAVAFVSPEPLRIVGSIVVFLILLHVVGCVRLGSDIQLIYLLVILFIGFILCGLLLPTLSRAGGRASPTPAVSILDRKIVGIFDTATISSHDPAALQDWLRANGFAAPANCDQAIASYVKDGWVFVAAKIRRDDPALNTATPHPLSFTFKTEKAVYPMRLTGIDNGPVQIDLYVFGPEQAKAPHFKAERCANPVYPKLPFHLGFKSMSFSDFSPNSASLQIVHPLLRKWVDGTPVASKLTANLDPTEMRDDIWISWTPFSEKGTTRFSHQGAWIFALNWGMGLFAALLLTAVVFALGSEYRRKQRARFIGFATGSGIIVTVVVYLLLPKVEVRIIRSHRPFSENYYMLRKFEYAATGETNLAEIRTWLAEGYLQNQTENYLSGGIIHEEDSPGNYQLRQGSNKVECVIYDASGAPSSE